METESGFNFDMGTGGGIDDSVLDGHLMGDLDDNEPAPGGGGSGDGETAEQRLAAQQAANKLLIERLDKVAQDNEALRARFDMSLENNRQTPPPAPPKPAEFNLEAFNQAASDLLIKNPGEYARQLAQAMAQHTETIIAQRLGPALGSTAALEVENYRRSKLGDDDDMRREFDSLVSDPATQTQLANVSPADRAKALDYLADMAYGRAARKRDAGNVRQNIPGDFGGGRGGGSSAPALSLGGKPLTPEQQLIVRTATEMGITDKKRIAAMLRDNG